MAGAYRDIGSQSVRVDLVERIARAAHEARRGGRPFAPDMALATSIGLTAPNFARLMVQLGFRAMPVVDGKAAGGVSGDGGVVNAGARWAWRGPPPRVKRAATPPRGAFAGLATLVARDG